MSGATVRLLGPDLPNALVLDNLSVDLSVLELKQRALAQLPPSIVEQPLIGQLKIIHQGRFLPDDKPIKEYKCVDGEVTAMHLIIKAQASKPTEASGDAEKQGGTRCTCIIS